MVLTLLCWRTGLPSGVFAQPAAAPLHGRGHSPRPRRFHYQGISRPQNNRSEHGKAGKCTVPPSMPLVPAIEAIKPDVIAGEITSGSTLSGDRRGSIVTSIGVPRRRISSTAPRIYRQSNSMIAAADHGGQRLVEQIIAHASDKALDKYVLRWLSQRDFVPRDAGTARAAPTDRASTPPAATSGVDLAPASTSLPIPTQSSRHTLPYSCRTSRCLSRASDTARRSPCQSHAHAAPQ